VQAKASRASTTELAASRSWKHRLHCPHGHITYTLPVACAAVQLQRGMGRLLRGNGEARLSKTECTFQRGHRISVTNATGVRVFTEVLIAYCENPRGAQPVEAVVFGQATGVLYSRCPPSRAT
jgi:hypothetical protein